MSGADSMQGARRLIGLPVAFPPKHGRQSSALITDVFFDSLVRRIVGLEVAVGTLVKRLKALPYEGIAHIAPRTVAARGESVLTDLDLLPARCRRVRRGARPLGLPVVDGDGKVRGVVADLFFDPETGRVVGYELSDGLFSDLVGGRRAVVGRIRYEQGGRSVRLVR